MNGQYYVQMDLVVEYLDINEQYCVMYTDRCIDKKYIDTYKNYDPNDDISTKEIKMKCEIERQINKYTYNKILYNNEWLKKSYQIKYECFLKKSYKEIYKLIKVYTKITAFKDKHI